MRLRVPFHSFAYGYPVFLTLLKTWSFSPLNGLGTLVENHLNTHVKVCSWNSVPLVSVSVLCQPHTVLITVLCSKFWNQEEWDFQLCSFVLWRRFFKTVLAIWGSLRFRLIWMWSFLFLPKSQWDFEVAIECLNSLLKHLLDRWGEEGYFRQKEEHDWTHEKIKKSLVHVGNWKSSGIFWALSKLVSLCLRVSELGRR